MGISLAPYDDSMRLGQGYNSFLQTPCMYDAVDISSRTTSTSPGLNNSQTVSYSSHIINRISDVARSMGISTGSTIKNGSIALGGNASSIDESKFAESHLNVVVSVKVINQNTEAGDQGIFIAEKAKTISDKAKFHETYGDSFIEGGDLHGVVSIKVLDSTKKEEVKALITRDINSSDPDSMGVDPSFLSSTSQTSLQGCETTIAVNWSGGGRIKPDNEEWSLESLFRVAAAFPAQVAACPRRTWAILTPYNNNATFLAWSIPKAVKPYDFHGVSTYAADLLDTYMAYKNNVRRIQAVLDSPRSYMRAPGSHPIEVSVKALVDARKEMKAEMSKIMEEVDILNNNPEGVDRPKSAKTTGTDLTGYKSGSPEEWATRLPIPRGITPQARNALRRFALLDGESYPPTGASPSSALGKPGDPPIERLFDGDVLHSFTKQELEALQWELNRRILKNYSFVAWPLVASTTRGGHGTPVPSDRLRDELRMNAVFANQFGWPRSVHLSITRKDDIPVLKFKFIFSQSEAPNSEDGFTVANLADNERIRAVRIGKTSKGNQEIISYVSIETTNGSAHPIGNAPSLKKNTEDFKVPSGCSGLLCFVATAQHKDTGAIGRLMLAWK
ncbi:hypothetical protein FRC07_009006 [Ceratobasidium sp. 392]|nr:hypothetical protein FRC07_009006 [Ceratobasidium sp. 392]